MALHKKSGDHQSYYTEGVINACTKYYSIQYLLNLTVALEKEPEDHQ